MKYLLSFLVVGFGLLFNQSFGLLYDIELVATQFGFTPDYTVSYSNLFRLDLNTHSVSPSNGTVYTVPYFGYGIYDNNVLTVDRLDHGQLQTTSNTYCYSNVVFNTSLYGLDTINGGCESPWTYYYASNFTPKKFTVSSFPSSTVQFDFGESNLSGLGFVEPVISNITPTKRPVYGFGNGFFDNNNYFTYNGSEFPRGARILYDTTGTNYLNSLDFVGPTELQPPIYAWELFGVNNTLTNYGYIVDSNGSKGKHFGLMSFGYSFAYNKNTSDITKVSWSDFGFFTVFDRSIDLIKTLGGLNFLATDSDQNYHNNGIMVLKKNQFSSSSSAGVVLISKNPSNLRQLLYQEFDCRTSNIKCLMNGGSDCSYEDGNTSHSSSFQCLVVSQGVLSYSGSTNVLPFINRVSYYNISDYPVLNYFLLNSNVLGNVWPSGNSYCFGITPGTAQICLDKVNGSQSIKESYLNGNFNNPYEDISTGTVNSGLVALCKTNAYFAVVNYDICHGINPSNILTISGVDYIVADVQYEDGTIVKKVVSMVEYNDGVGLDEIGQPIVICSDTQPCDSSSSGSVYFSGGILDSSYYSFDNTGLFFKCPYPYNSLLSFKGWNLNVGEFDILGPINCLIAGFKHGKSFDVFDNVGLFDFGPLFSGNTQQHRILFRFFDMCLILGFALFFSLIYKRFK